MGSRGRGSLLSKQDRERALKSKKKLPWKVPGLSRPDRVIAFLEFLPITKGILVGTKMELLPNQKEFIRAVYGPTRPDGRRRVTLAIKSEPKGNGKTGLVAGLCLCHLLGPEAEPRGACYSAATDREQAAITFNEMEAILFATPELAAHVNIVRFTKRIEVLEGSDGVGSTYEALSSDAKKAQGLAPSFWAYDELAQENNRDLLDNLMEGLGKRKEALGVVISTQAKSDDHALSQLIDDGQSGADPSVYVQMTAVPPDGDIYDERVLQSVNPAWGKFLDLDDLLRSRDRARRIPAFEPAFRNLRCNQRVDAGSEARVITAVEWKRGNDPVRLARLEGRPCYGGLDLSAKHDLSAAVFVFPDTDDGDDPTFDVVCLYWTPEGQLETRREREQTLFRGWIKKGLITAVPGNTIRYTYVARQLGEFAKRHDIRALAYDRWRIDDFKADLAEEGVTLPLVPFGQGFRDMGPAVDYFQEVALDGRLRHGGHPVLTSNIANSIVVSDPASNQKIDKTRSTARSSTRIDGAVCLIMGLGIYKRMEGDVLTPPVDLDAFLRSPVAA